MREFEARFKYGGIQVYAFPIYKALLPSIIKYTEITRTAWGSTLNMRVFSKYSLWALWMESTACMHGFGLS